LIIARPVFFLLITVIKIVDTIRKVLVLDNPTTFLIYSL